MLTADTITDEEIRKLREDAALRGDKYTVDQTFEALGEWGIFWSHCVPATPTGKAGAERKARAWCAEILNARRPGDTITDEEIRAYHNEREPTDEVHEVCRIALYAAPGSTKRAHARAQVAEWINARKERP